jgi:potassium-transporting ATPase KdpC subunit
MTEVRTALATLAAFTLLTGIAYPLLVTGLAQVLFPRQANGSLIVVDGKVVGSELIGQNFSESKYFWPRPSATAPTPYNAGASSGSNYGVLNPNLQKSLNERIQVLRTTDPTNTLPIPVDLVTASGSGLDPHISPASAVFQAPRIARVRNLPLPKVHHLIQQHTSARQFGFLGEPTVNVLGLNLALDKTKK